MDYEIKADGIEAVFEQAVTAGPVIRPVLSGATQIADPARTAFVNSYLRRGSEVELKSFSGAVAADGGFAIPREIDEVIDATLKSISPIRAIANVVRVGSAGYRKLVTQNGVASGWASETATRPETATPTFNEIVPAFGELYANPAATQTMLDDAQFDVEGWLASEIATEFAKAEGSAFVNGNGTNKPRGFLTAPNAVTGDATRAFGTLQYVASGAAGAFVASNPQDKLVELMHSLRAPYRQGATWVMNSSTLATIRKFKTTDGAFIWQPGLVAGQPDTLLGYRGLAYAVFEDLQLADYGNRIPSLTFEIFERETPVPLNAIFGSASSAVIQGSSAETVIGCALSATDARGALSPLLDSFPVLLRPKDGKLELLDGWQPSATPFAIEPVAETSGKKHDRPMVAMAPAYTAPRALSVRHYEPARDFQAGLQNSESGRGGRLSQQIELPAAMTAAGAKRLAELNLLQRHRNRESWVVQGAVNADMVSVGQWVSDAQGRAWQITEIEHFQGSTKISAQAYLSVDPSVSAAASPGCNIGAPDLTAGQTEFAVIDLPVFDLIDPAKAVIGIFANGTESGWRGAALSVRQNDQLVEIGSTAVPAVIGRSIEALGPHHPHLLDSRHALNVQMAHEGIEFTLTPGNSAICWLEGEFIRFGSVTALGDGRYRLTNLQRGCFASEAAIEGHQIGDRFVLLEMETVRLIDNFLFAPGSTLTVEALGLGDDVPVWSATPITSKAIMPLPPAHGSGRVLPGGGVELGWTRRSRIDFGWNDGIDQALAEDVEQYSVSVAVGGEIAGFWTAPENTLILTPQTVAELVAVSGPKLEFSVCQIGRHMQSPPITIDVFVTL